MVRIHQVTVMMQVIHDMIFLILTVCGTITKNG